VVKLLQAVVRRRERVVGHWMLNWRHGYVGQTRVSATIDAGRLALGSVSIRFLPHIDPVVGLFHVLLAVGLALGFVRARMEVALEHGRVQRVLVVPMAVQLLFRRPSTDAVLARFDAALERPKVSLVVLGEVTRSLKLPVASRFPAYLGSRQGRWRILPATGH